MGISVTVHQHYAETQDRRLRLRDMIDPTLVCLGYGQILSHRLRSSGSTFMYLVHLISIDLQ